MQRGDRCREGRELVLTSSAADDTENTERLGGRFVPWRQPGKQVSFP